MSLLFGFGISAISWGLVDHFKPPMFWVWMIGIVTAVTMESVRRACHEGKGRPR